MQVLKYFKRIVLPHPGIHGSWMYICSFSCAEYVCKRDGGRGDREKEREEGGERERERMREREMVHVHVCMPVIC